MFSAAAIREEYDAVVQGNPIFNIGGRIKLARQYNRAAGKALDRTKASVLSLSAPSTL